MLDEDDCSGADVDAADVDADESGTDGAPAAAVVGVTVPAGETVDVVVYAVDNAPLGVGPYTLSCSAQ